MTTNQPIGTLPYFYDAQMRRILLQFMRIFTVFKYQTGAGGSSPSQYISVPVVYGDGDRQAQFMLTGNSENVTQSIPKIAVSILNLKPQSLSDRGGFQGNLQDTLVSEREFDPKTNSYNQNLGNSYHVQALFPVPLDIQFKVDIWTSNTDQKFQLFEQIYTLFNPSLNLQTTNNPMDWTAINTVILDDITWEANGPDQGTDDVTDIMTMLFTAQCWINPPARVTRQVLIHTILERLGNSIEDCDSRAVFDDGSSIYTIVTPGNHQALVLNGEITLLGPNGNVTDINNNIYSWPQLLDEYGGLNVGESKISLRWVNNITDDSKDIMGLISLHPTQDNILLFDTIEDTLPIATQMPVNALIDPHSMYPGNGLPAVATGQRYILSNNIGGTTTAWGNLAADKNDIIEYNGTNWFVSLDASSDNNIEFVTNSQTGRILRFQNNQWADAIDAQYQAGYFNLIL